MLNAMNTGHSGCMTSIHGNSPRDALDRLALLGSMTSEHVSEDALLKMVAHNIELVLQLQLDPETGQRRLVSLFEVTGLEGGTITGQDLWATDSVDGRLRWTGLQPRCMARISARGLSYALPSAALRDGNPDGPIENPPGLILR